MLCGAEIETHGNNEDWGTEMNVFIKIPFTHCKPWPIKSNRWSRKIDKLINRLQHEGIDYESDNINSGEISLFVCGKKVTMKPGSELKTNKKNLKPDDKLIRCGISF